MIASPQFLHSSEQRINKTGVDVKNILIAGNEGNLFIAVGNALWSCGENKWGQLGTGGITARHILTRIADFGLMPGEQIVQIAVGLFHTVILSSRGGMWACGSNHSGQLGLGHTEHRFVLTRVADIGLMPGEQIVEIAVGLSHTVARSSRGRIWACGCNSSGQLGVGDTERRLVLTPILLESAEVGLMPNEQIVQIVAAHKSTFVLSSIGRVWACGNNHDGQLGVGDITPRLTLTRVADFGRMMPGEKIVEIVMNKSCTVVRSSNDRMWACGDHEFAQLGVGDMEPHLVLTPILIEGMDFERIPGERTAQLVMGLSHTIVRRSTGGLWVCGNNQEGQLGAGHATHCLVLTRVADFGLMPNEQIIQIAAGDGHTVILSSRGRVWACGFNKFGQLGVGDRASRFVLTPVADVRLMPGEQIVQIAALAQSTIVLSSIGRVWACGLNEHGQLGVGNAAPHLVLSVVGHLTHPAWMPEHAVAVIDRDPQAVALPTRDIAYVNMPDGYTGLPEEVLKNIFSLLSVENLHDVMRVCAKFREIVLQTCLPKSLPPPIVMSGVIQSPDSRVTLLHLLYNARAIYNVLPPDQQEAFKRVFIKSTPNKIGMNLLQLLSPPQ